MHPRNLFIADYTYELPNDRIANFPLDNRDASQLLIYKDGKISQTIYTNIADHLPSKSILVFNNTKVIQARILFSKKSGGVIEIFCLEPYETTKDYSVIMQKQGSVKWKCMIGGASKWKEGPLQKTIRIYEQEVVVSAKLIEKLSEAYVVEFSWEPQQYSFAEIIELAGQIPLPPYIKRKPETQDSERYQTIFAEDKGSVAAPTAGLHFTEAIIASFAKKEISVEKVTLHVGAGTFKPVKAVVMENHEMHAEWLDVSAETIQNLLDGIAGNIIATGTTSLRSIESLYWMGLKTILDPDIHADNLVIRQWDVYESPLCNHQQSAKNCLESLLRWMKRNGLSRLLITTQILIAPGYRFKVAKGLITNFHQPQSTLLLLVAAAIGPDWEKVYNYALENDFRFLSYGDGSLLFFPQQL